MKKNYHIELTEDARESFVELVLFYESLKYNLGNELLDDYDKSIKKLSANPQHYFNISKKFRRIKFERFRCMIIYRIKNDIVEVVAIVDMRSKPNKNFY